MLFTTRRNPAGDHPPDGSVAPEVIKRVSWAELFYDLVFVYAVTQVSRMLASHPDQPLDVWVLFTPFWWSWVGTCILSNLTDLERVRERLRLFAIALATFLMAAAAPAALTDRAVFFA